MEAERRISKAHVTLMRHPKFAHMSGIFMVGDSTVEDNVKTASTNGRDKKYGRAFVDAQNDKAVNFLVLHENYHVMYRHLTTWEALYKIDAMMANEACDYVINGEILDADPTGQLVELPKLDGQTVGLYDRRFKGMNTKQVWDILRQEQEERGGNRDNDPNGGGMDDHDWDGAKEMDEEEQKELEREVDQAIRQGIMAAEKMHGAEGGDARKRLKHLLEPKVDWREVLREFITSVCNNKDQSSWRKINRRFIGEDMYMPSLIGESVGGIAVCPDMSGSTWTGDMFQRIMTEVVSVAEMVTPEKVDLLYWDWDVTNHEEYVQGQYQMMKDATKPQGGGGTRPACVQQFIKDKFLKPECIIMLTDGYVSDWGNNWPAPVLWVIINNKNAKPTNGTVVYIND